MEKTDCRYFNAEDGNCLHFTYPGEYDPCTDGDFKHCCESYPHFFGDKIVPHRFKTKEYGDFELVFLTDDGHTIGKIHRDSISIVDRMNDLNGWAQGMQKKNNRLSTEMSALYEENEELKQELAIYRNLISCSNCKYQNYNWYDDGDEFEVCDKGNDVTDEICEDWEEIN